MRVLIYAPFYPPHQGGASQYFPNLANSLSETDNVYLLTSYHPDRPLHTVNNSYVHIYRIIPRCQELPKLLRMIIETTTAFIVSLWIIFSKRIDVAHVHSTAYATPAIGLATVLTSIPIIYDCRDENFPRWILKIGNPQMVFSCAPNIDDVLNEAGFSSDKIVRVPALNPEYVSEFRIEEFEKKEDSPLEVIFVGHFKKVKNIKTLIQAFSEFIQNSPDAHLTLVGDGPLDHEISKSIEEYELHNNMTLTGKIEHQKTLEYIADSDVLVLPSSSEGDPRVIREALEIGTPVIATSVGTIPKMVDDGETGYLIDQSRESIVSALRRVSDSNQRVKMAMKAQQSSKENENWESLGKKISNVYKTITDNN